MASTLHDNNDVIVVKKGKSAISYYTNTCNVCNAELQVNATLPTFSCPECGTTLVNKKDSDKCVTRYIGQPNINTCIKCKNKVDPGNDLCFSCKQKLCSKCGSFSCTKKVYTTNFGNTTVHETICYQCGYNTKDED